MKLRKLLLLFVFALTAVANAQQLPPVPVDTGVRIGKLPNGLTYYIRHNEWPEHVANFYIAQRVGSLQEEEDQRGLAHFLEHMAFNGSEHFKENGITEFCRSLGVAFGRDLNAYTSFNQTVYNVNNVPTTRQSALDSCLIIIKDWSNGLLLEDKEIDKERGVIHGEWAMRNNASMRLLESNLPRLFPGSKWGVRLPIGLMSVVDNFTYDALRKYYKKWYRPDNQAVIVVGDVDVDHTEKVIKELFGSIPLDPNAPKVEKYPVPDNYEPIYFVDKDKELRNNQISVNMKIDAMPDSLKSRMDYLMLHFIKLQVRGMLESRFNELAQKPECNFVAAYGNVGSYTYSDTKDAFQLTVVPKENKDLEALREAVREIMRAKQHGFTESELIRSKDGFMSWIEKEYLNRDKRDNDNFGSQYSSHFVSNEPIPSIEDEHQIWNMISKIVTLETVNHYAKDIISVSDTNLVVYEFAQEKEGRIVPTADELRKTYEAARAEKLEPWVDNTKNEPLIAELPKKGSIKNTTENAALGYKELALSNGATVILKKTDYKTDEIQLTAFSKGGTCLYGEKDYSNLKFIRYANNYSGLGNFSNNELQKALAGKQCEVGFNMNVTRTNLTGHTTPKDIETFLQLVYLNFTSVAKDTLSFNSFVGQLKLVLPNQGLQPEYAFEDSLCNVIYSGNPRFSIPGEKDINKISYDRCLEIIKERTANAANYTFVFVGNYDEATLLPLIEQYIASLPAKKADNVALKDVNTYFKGEKKLDFKRKMESPKPQLANMYYAPAENTRKNDVLMRYTSEVLSNEMLKQVREDASAAYHCSASCGINLTGSTPLVTLNTSAPISEPSKLDMAAELMKKIVNEAAEKVDPDKVTKIRENMLKEAEISFKNNNFWVSTIVDWKLYGKDNYTDYKKLIENVKPEDISSYIKNVILKGGNHAEVIMRPE
ncbi:MAG: insulinase family protein [Prevotella sp.]|nr:insulinase family protein [Prevotella sp.]